MEGACNNLRLQLALVTSTGVLDVWSVDGARLHASCYVQATPSRHASAVLPGPSSAAPPCSSLQAGTSPEPPLTPGGNPSNLKPAPQSPAPAGQAAREHDSDGDGSDGDDADANDDPQIVAAAALMHQVATAAVSMEQHQQQHNAGSQAQLKQGGDVHKLMCLRRSGAPHILATPPTTIRCVFATALAWPLFVRMMLVPLVHLVQHASCSK